MAEKCKKNRLSLHSFEKCQSQCLFKNERASQGSCFALDTKQPHPLPSPHKATFTLLPSSGSPAPPEPHPPYTQLPDPARSTHAGNTGSPRAPEDASTGGPLLDIQNAQVTLRKPRLSLPKSKVSFLQSSSPSLRLLLPRRPASTTRAMPTPQSPTSSSTQRVQQPAKSSHAPLSLRTPQLQLTFPQPKARKPRVPPSPPPTRRQHNATRPPTRTLGTRTSAPGPSPPSPGAPRSPALLLLLPA